MQPIAHSYTIGAHLYEAPSLTPALYLVATPIGNLSDISLRALAVLAAADIIACEDIRVSLKLLNHYSIKAKLLSYHEHNAARIGPNLIAAIEAGQVVALISDAGTPLICDPGFDLVHQARQKDLKVVPIPGACAAITALSAASLPTKQFYFIGFLPAKQIARRKKLFELSAMTDTLVFYESPHRLAKTLSDMAEIFGPARVAAICRELTKKFEEYKVSELASLAKYYVNNVTKLGEIVILVAPALEAKAEYDIGEIRELLTSKRQTMSAAQAAVSVAKITGLKKQEVYRLLLED